MKREEEPGLQRQGPVRTEEALRSGEWLQVCIADTGHGIPPQELQRVFEPPFSLRTFRLGLGLSSARAIVQRHGGTIRLESKEGVGTTVRVELPRGPGAGA